MYISMKEQYLFYFFFLLVVHYIWSEQHKSVCYRLSNLAFYIFSGRTAVLIFLWANLVFQADLPSVAKDISEEGKDSLPLLQVSTSYLSTFL